MHWRKIGSDQVPEGFATEMTDGELTSAEEGGSRGEASAEYGTPSEYRSWRMGQIPGKVENRIQSPVISEYGTPQEYQAWRNFHRVRKRRISV